MFFFIASVSAFTFSVAAVLVSSETVNDIPGMVLAKVLLLDSTSMPLSLTLAFWAVWVGVRGCPSAAGSELKEPKSTVNALSVPVSLERSIKRSLPSTSVTIEAWMPMPASLILVAILVSVSEDSMAMSLLSVPMVSLMVPAAPMVWSLGNAEPPAPPSAVVWAWARCMTWML